MLEYKGYRGKVEYDADARIFHGEVIGLRDVITFQGMSVEEIETAFRDSIDDYLDFCEARGESPDKPYSGKFVVRMSEELHRSVADLAQLEDESLNTVVLRAVEQYVAKEGERSYRARRRARER
jgi:predicted HicB family RNase H-like nuclease